MQPAEQRLTNRIRRHLRYAAREMQDMEIDLDIAVDAGMDIDSLKASIDGIILAATVMQDLVRNYISEYSGKHQGEKR